MDDLQEHKTSIGYTFTADQLLTLINSERHEAYLLGVVRGVGEVSISVGDKSYFITETELRAGLADLLKRVTKSKAWKKETL